jgi:hypothetical protein
MTDSTPKKPLDIWRDAGQPLKDYNRYMACDHAYLLKRNLVRIEFENGNRLLPKVFIEDGLFNDLYLPWQDSLVIKLLGK